MPVGTGGSRHPGGRRASRTTTPACGRAHPTSCLTSPEETDPSSATPQNVATAQRQQRILQWVTPALTAVIVALGAQQGEQQRPSQMLGGIRARLPRVSHRSYR
ncbi:hypothetical protein F6X54_01705 [Micromonospora aurantiaca]|uniref:Uncharacterized protein n=1 Tax=Micromonospora aurantiaca (nom. illeg.) TaxID=47850 RepID=A0ABQ6UNM9_9ACTN|nr:hypothetical protein F6X54_01705 [Micromonospora aurantiaca]